MDKLQPLIKHRFWVIFGLTFPIILWAYYSASGKMATATTDREQLLDATYSGVPQGVSEPNQKFAQGAGEINKRPHDPCSVCAARGRTRATPERPRLRLSAMPWAWQARAQTRSPGLAPARG